MKFTNCCCKLRGVDLLINTNFILTNQFQKISGGRQLNTGLRASFGMGREWAIYTGVVRRLSKTGEYYKGSV